MMHPESRGWSSPGERPGRADDSWRTETTTHASSVSALRPSEVFVAMTHHSVLFRTSAESADAAASAIPVFFPDLNLDQVVEAVTAGREEYDLGSFFRTPLRSTDSIAYRHEVMLDLDRDSVFVPIAAFGKAMRVMRAHLSQSTKRYYPLQKSRWFLEAAVMYCAAVKTFDAALASTDATSRGLTAFREYLRSYAGSEAFTALFDDSRRLIEDLSAIRYCIRIYGDRVVVRPSESEADYGAEVEEAFGKFRQADVKDYRVSFPETADMNHVEAKILDMVARLFPDPFSLLEAFCARYADFTDAGIAAFDREIQFYIAWLEYVSPLRRAGLSFCYPRVSETDRDIRVIDGFDTALAYKLVAAGSPVVCNDLRLEGPERILVVSGPNQGGKTTFARMFGQTHFLASIGCTVPGKEARLFLFDRMHTHFEKEESISKLHGKLQDDLIRIRDILDESTRNSIIILNELFSSTTLQDAVFLGKEIMERITALDAFCVCVTFIDELASLNEKTVSLTSSVVPENPTQRTFKIQRRAADGLAYAVSIAEKHGLTRDQIRERIRS